MDHELAPLLTAMLRRHYAATATLTAVVEQPQNQGFSGATIRRFQVQYQSADGPGNATLLTKDGPLAERRVLDLLNAQGQPAVPRSHSLDLSSPERELFCMEAIEGDESVPAAELPPLTAAGLAAIHAANLGRGGELPWLPQADPAHFAATVINEYWREPWQESLRNPEFAAAYGQHTAALEQAAERFLADMAELWQANASLTLIHADMQPPSGGHLLVSRGRPYLADWGQARYGSLYLDLPNHWNPTTVEHYRLALAAHGITIPPAEFMARYRIAGRYVGFKFLGTMAWFWENGSRGEDGLGAFDFMLQCAIRGRLPHRWSGSGA